MKRKVFITAIAVLAFSFNMFAQSADSDQHSHGLSMVIPEVALVDVHGADAIVLTVEAPTEAGLGLDFTNATSSASWMNYSSIKSTNDATRTITAQVVEGATGVPDGVLLYLAAGSDAGNGKGSKGSASSEVLLNDGTAKTIVTGIGSCYTGDGTSNGHNLTYRLALDDETDGYATLANATTSINIQYTISDN